MVILSEWIAKIVSDPEAVKIITQSEDRIGRAYKEMLAGYELHPKDILNKVAKVKNYSGLVVERNIAFTSICGHHFLPYFGTIDIVYEPGTHLTGLGKLPRLAKAVSQKFQLQEIIVRDIAHALMDHIDAKGAFVRCAAKHLCVCGRGPKSENAETVCTYAIGSLDDCARRQEIMNLL